VKRLTIADIAAAAGVSTGAVSYALNNKPGVSPSTRDKVLRIATELGWRPSSAARALTDGRSGAIGLIVDRPTAVLGIEPFFMQLVSGIQAELNRGSRAALTLQVTEDPETEIATYRNWWAERRVDGVIVVDLREDDSRLQVLDEIGLPAVALGYPQPSAKLPCVWSDEGAAIIESVGYLSTLGHRRIARVAGPRNLAHTAHRDRAFAEAADAVGLAATTVVHTDYSGDEGARATRRLLSQRARPTAIIFDNDVMALASLGAAQELGIDVPGQLSLIAWEDSALCQLVRPALTAVSRDIPSHGACAVGALERLMRGEVVEHVQAPQPVLTPRASTARAAE
jgi:DNA-binding LacI/PurR family transcriptional regulator